MKRGAVTGKVAGRVLAAGLLALPIASFAQVSPAGHAEPPLSKTANPAAESADIRVMGSRPAPPAQIDPIELFDKSFVTGTDAFTVDEVLTQLSASLAGTQQVVLIDGQETLVDISTIPADRIERIEVSTTGVMPDGRPRIVGNVINVILKKRYNGANFVARRRGSFRGGGGQSQMNASGGLTHGKVGVFINVIHREQDPLLASQRDFSRAQDYMAAGGADYRAPYGAASVVRAVTGFLGGITDANSAPVSIALAPATPPSHAITPADFIPAPAGTTSAAGLRHFNTSDFLYLAAPSSTNVVNSDLNLAVTANTNLHAGFTFTRTDSQQSGPPPITPVSTATVVPAAYSPFGQVVEVGLVHAGFGAVQRQTSADRRSGYLSADGHFASTWTWSGRFDSNRRGSTSETHDLDATKFAAALATTDPAVRFDPFADTGPGSANAALYPSLTALRRSLGTSADRRLRAESRGQVSRGWIAPVFLGGGVDRSTHDSQQSLEPDASRGAGTQTRSRLNSLRVNASLDIPAFRVRELESPAMLTLSTYLTHDQQRSNQQTIGVLRQSRLDVKTRALNGLLDIPWSAPADARPGAYQLQTQIGMGLSRAQGKSNVTADVGALWSPTKPWSLRAHYARQQAPAPVVLYPLSVDYNQTLIDRRRVNSLANNVEVISRQPDAPGPPLVSQVLLSVQWVPPPLEKLRLTLTYSDVTQRGQQRNFSAQDVLDNEGALPGRVTRLPPTDADLANGLPGEIVQVDVTAFSGGQRRDRSAGLMAQFSGTSPKLGTLTFRGSGQHLLSSSNELIAGVPIVSISDQEAPPAWNFSTQVDWQLGAWRAGSTFNYLGSGRYAGLPYASFGTLDARVTYQIDNPFNGWLGKTLRIGAGIQNLFDADPPFANTILGFRGGSALGRTYELTLRAIVGD